MRLRNSDLLVSVLASRVSHRLSDESRTNRIMNAGGVTSREPLLGLLCDAKGCVSLSLSLSQLGSLHRCPQSFISRVTHAA